MASMISKKIEQTLADAPSSMIYHPKVIPKRCTEVADSRNVELSRFLHKIAPRIVQSPVTPLRCSFGLVSVEESGPMTIKSVLKRELKSQSSNVAVLFCIKQAGCGNCREQALQLSKDLIKLDRKIALVGLVQDIDDPDLAEFYRDYFHFPIFQDAKWVVGNAIAGRARDRTEGVKDSFYQRIFSKEKKCKIDTGSRQSYTGASGNGLLIFDKKCRLRFAYEEEFGEDLNLEAILSAARVIRASRTAGDDESTIAPSVADAADCLSVFELSDDVISEDFCQ